MMKLIKLAGVAALAALATTGVARAEDEKREFSWSMTVGGTSDYMFRGLSLHNEDPAAQGSLDMGYGIFYAGVWGSNVGNGTQDGFSPMEVDLYAGLKPVVGQFTFDFGIIGYLYPIAEDALDYYELKAGVSTEIVKSLTGGVIVYWVPEQENSPEVWTVEGNLAYTLPEMHRFTPTISGTVGYATSDLGWFSRCIQGLRLLERRPCPRHREADFRLPLLGHQHRSGPGRRLRRPERPALRVLGQGNAALILFPIRS